MRRSLWLVAGLLLLGLWLWSQRPNPSGIETTPAAGSGAAVRLPTPATPAPDTGRAERGAPDSHYPVFLPAEAIATMRLIQRGGPFAHRQDGAVFGNRERHLPQQPRGYYHEYTVVTHGARDRGARRIVTGGEPPVEYFYSDDHYRSFRRFSLPGEPR